MRSNGPNPDRLSSPIAFDLNGVPARIIGLDGRGTAQSYARGDAPWRAPAASRGAVLARITRSGEIGSSGPGGCP